MHTPLINEEGRYIYLPYYPKDGFGLPHEPMEDYRGNTGGRRSWSPRWKTGRPWSTC